MFHMPNYYIILKVNNLLTNYLYVINNLLIKYLYVINNLFKCYNLDIN
ncbi:MAG: hypothetical protein ACI8WT_000542 [Clostridium sp.]|jgi:hypothetical protein